MTFSSGEPTPLQHGWLPMVTQVLNVRTLWGGALGEISGHSNLVARTLSGSLHTDEDRERVVVLLGWLHEQQRVLRENRVALGIFNPEGWSREFARIMGLDLAREHHHEIEQRAITALTIRLLAHAIGPVRGGMLIPLLRCAEYEAAGIGSVEARRLQFAGGRPPSLEALRTLTALNIP